MTVWLTVTAVAIETMLYSLTFFAQQLEFFLPSCGKIELTWYFGKPIRLSFTSVATYLMLSSYAIVVSCLIQATVFAS